MSKQMDKIQKLVAAIHCTPAKLLSELREIQGKPPVDKDNGFSPAEEKFLYEVDESLGDLFDKHFCDLMSDPRWDKTA